MKAPPTTHTPSFTSIESKDSTDLNGMNMLLEAIACIDNSIITTSDIMSVLPPHLKLEAKNTYYNYNSVHGYDLCNLCGKKVALTKDGAVRKHRCIIMKETF